MLSYILVLSSILFFTTSSSNWFYTRTAAPRLQKRGILEVTGALKQQLEAGTQLPAGSQEEVELRGCSIEAVELLREAIQVR